MSVANEQFIIIELSKSENLKSFHPVSFMKLKAPLLYEEKWDHF